MRPSPAAKRYIAGAILLFGLSSTVAMAQEDMPEVTAQQQAVIDRTVAGAREQITGGMSLSNKASMSKALEQAYNMQGQLLGKQKTSLFGEVAAEELTEEEMRLQLMDKNSTQYKARMLAKQAEKDMALFGAAAPQNETESLDVNLNPPPEMEALQDVKTTNAAGHDMTDDAAVSKEMALDMRRDAQKEAAMSYGARGGLSKRNYQIAERMKGYEATLDTVFNFRQMLIKAPSGLMIEPPIVRENLEAVVITEGGNEAAVADQILKINKQAKIVTAPRDWRQYLVMPYQSEIAPPPRVLWPKNKEEQAEWNGWVKKGWEAGYNQGEEIFEASLNQLVVDYNGMVRYRTLLAEGKISQPYAMQEDRGITGGGDQMRVGDRALRITGPSEFLTGANQWKPADR
jgi:defect-in-organelle-trafficking protein DotC